MTNDTTETSQFETIYYIVIQLDTGHSYNVCETNDKNQHDKDIAQLDADLAAELLFVALGNHHFRASRLISYASATYEWAK